jgi:hypothetical protein
MTNEDSNNDREEFGELLRYTLVGYAGGISLGFLLDRFGFQRSGVGQWLVRTIRLVWPRPMVGESSSE